MRNNVTWKDLVACARRVGVEVMEAPSSHRGKKGSMGTVRGLTLHHTGTKNNYRPNDDYPDFNVVKEGRSGLVNSLSAFGIGRKRYIYVFSEFLSWHAGSWNWKGITDGNGDFLGIEAAGVGDWTPFQRAVYPRLVASLLLFLGEGIDMAPRHADGATPRGRKSDAANFGDWFYRDVEFFMNNPAYININYQEDDLMSALDTPIPRSTGEGDTSLRAFLRHADEHIVETRRIIREEVRKAVADEVWWKTDVIRGDAKIPALQELADAKTLLLSVNAKLDALLGQEEELPPNPS